MPRLLKAERTRAFGLFKSGKSCAEVARTIGKPYQTVYNWNSIWKKCANGGVAITPESVTRDLGFSPNNPFVKKALGWEKDRASLTDAENLLAVSQRRLTEAEGHLKNLNSQAAQLQKEILAHRKEAKLMKGNYDAIKGRLKIV